MILRDPYTEPGVEAPFPFSPVAPQGPPRPPKARTFRKLLPPNGNLFFSWRELSPRFPPASPLAFSLQKDKMQRTVS